jgi:hypothetical protein
MGSRTSSAAGAATTTTPVCVCADVPPASWVIALAPPAGRVAGSLPPPTSRLLWARRDWRAITARPARGPRSGLGALIPGQACSALRCGPDAGTHGACPTASGWILTDAAVDGLSRAVRGGVREVARIGGHAASALASVLASRLAFAQVARCSQWRPMSDQCWWECRGYRPSSS